MSYQILVSLLMFSVAGFYLGTTPLDCETLMGLDHLDVAFGFQVCEV